MTPLHRFMLGLLALAAAGATQAAGLSLGVTLGTRAIAPQVGYSFSPTFGLRATFSSFDLDHDTTEEDIDYSGEFTLSNVSLLADWHPFASSFRLTAGAVAYNDELDLVAKARNGFVTVNGTTYPVSPNDRIDGHIEWKNEVVPYLGIGWGNPGAQQAPGFGFTADLGVMFTGSPEATLKASGPNAGNPLFENDLRKEEADLNDNISDAKFWPVINLGAFYAF